MLVATPAGVIATGPIGYRRPQSVTTCFDSIGKVTDTPTEDPRPPTGCGPRRIAGKPRQDAV
jgi:hypothetical protein